MRMERPENPNITDFGVTLLNFSLEFCVVYKKHFTEFSVELWDIEFSVLVGI